jgi:tRNA A-37 threonylcarbamoyl transferase component Bud32
VRDFVKNDHLYICCDITIPKMYVKQDVSESEYEFYLISASLGLSPHVISYDINNRTLKSVLIPAICVADKYGDDADDLPLSVWKNIRKIVTILYSHGLEYADITGDNFIEDRSGIVWIIDFGHCKRVSQTKSFTQQFIEDSSMNIWNGVGVPPPATVSSEKQTI